jgi:hypothetical protein
MKTGNALLLAIAALGTLAFGLYLAAATQQMFSGVTG